MSRVDQTTLHVMLYEGKGTRPLSGSERKAAVSALLGMGCSVTCTTDERAAFASELPQVAVVGYFEGCHIPAQMDTASGGRAYLINLAEVAPAELAARVEAAQMRAAGTS
jgi:hypothetical protein